MSVRENERSRIRVLQVITTTIGGAGEHVLLLSRGLDRARFDVTVAFGTGMPLDQAFYAAGLRVVELPMRRVPTPIASIKSLLALWRLIRLERFDIVHTHTSVAGAIGRLAAFLNRAPVVVHMIHAYAAHDFVSPLKRRALAWIERSMNAITDHFIAGSDAMRRKGLEKGVVDDARRITLIHTAIDWREHDRLAARGRAIRQELGIGSNDVAIGLVGRLEPQKGVEYFLGAAARLLRSPAQTAWVVVGDGPRRAEYESLAARLGVHAKVRFLGWRSDIPDVMEAIDILAIPSRWEAFGIVILEAMRARRPVVGFGVEGIPEVIEDGVTGIVVPPYDEEAFASALARIAGDRQLAASMGARGRLRLERLFGAERMVSSHEKLYERLLGEAKGVGNGSVRS